MYKESVADLVIQSIHPATEEWDISHSDKTETCNVRGRSNYMTNSITRKIKERD